SAAIASSEAGLAKCQTPPRLPIGGTALKGYRLTVKLRGRTTTPDERRGRTLPPGARGAKQTTPHGPLQRLLDGTPSRRHAHKQGKLFEALGNDDGFP